MATPYEVAIHLTVSGNAQAGLAGLSAQMNKLNEGAEKLHKAFALIFVGGEMKRWGEEALGWVNKVLDAAGNFQHVQSQMSAMGMTQAEIAAATGTAWKNATANIHVGVQEMAEMNRHAVEIFGSAGAAAEHMDLMARLADFQAKWGAGKTGLKQVDVPLAIRDMMKTTEGAAMLSEDPKKFDIFAEKLMRSLIAAGGNVPATQILQAQRLARGAQFPWSDSFRFGVFPALVQVYGHAAGTSSWQAYKKLSAGIEFTKTGIVQGIEMGLIDPNKVEYDKVGRPLRLMKGAMIHGAEYAEDPLKFTEKYITPWLNKNTKNAGERTDAIARLLGKATGMTTVQAFDLQAYRFEKDRRLWGQARMDMPDDYAQAMKALEEKWKDFMVALGTPSLKDATSALGLITKVIMELTAAARAHPDAPKNLLAVAVGFGAVMTVLGTLAVSAGIAGLLGTGVIIVGLTALTGALAGLAAANWPAVSSWGERLVTAVMDSLNKVQKAITDMFQRIIDWIASKIPDWIKNSFHDISGSMSDWGGGGLSAGALSAGERGQYAGIIRKIAMQEGVDPNALLKIYGTEGASAWYGDGGHSFGPFQLYDKGLGAIYHGDRSRSAHGVEEQTRFVARYGKSHGGWSSDIWHGLRGHRGSIPLSRRGGETHVHNNIYLDGKMIARSTSKQFVRAAQYPTSVGRQDGRGTFMGPGAEVFA